MINKICLFLAGCVLLFMSQASTQDFNNLVPYLLVPIGLLWILLKIISASIRASRRW